MVTSKTSIENFDNFKFRPALLRTESKEEFEKLFDELRRYAQPAKFVELMYVQETAELTWEIMRHRRTKAGIIDNALRNALEKLIGTLLLPPGHNVALLVEKYWGAKSLAYEWFYSREAKCRVSALLKEAGLDMGAVEAEAVRASLSDIEKLERLVASAQARRDKYLSAMENRLASKLREGSDRLLSADDVPSVPALNSVN
jgi:hypothetical protein